jgi:hypothetical protein
MIQKSKCRETLTLSALGLHWKVETQKPDDKKWHLINQQRNEILEDADGPSLLLDYLGQTTYLNYLDQCSILPGL